MCAYLLSHFSSVQLFVIPWTITHQASLFMGFSQEYRSGLPCPPPGNLPDSGLRDQTHVSCLLHWQAGFVPLSHQGSPLYHQFSSVQFSSVAQSCPTLQPHESQHARPPCPSPIPKLTQTHVHRVGDTICIIRYRQINNVKGHTPV